MATRAYDDPVLEQRRLEALGQIRQYGDPVLRTPSEAIVVFDDALRREAASMAALMQNARGVGLAAPQLGRLRRLVVIRPSEEAAPVALCNPRVAWRAEDEEVDTEGCLSIGEVTVEVARAVAVRVEAQDTDGQTFTLELEGFPARVVQHEIDHLDGILMLDRTTPEQRREALRALRDAAG
jgi:peptide deformylase